MIMGTPPKRVAIARSGVYMYSAESLRNLGLSAPPEGKSRLRSFSVYRPATVLARNKDKFTRLPVTLEHPPMLLNGENFREFVQGFTGDTAYLDFIKEIGEITVASTLVLMDSEAMNAYYGGTVEVSPGYVALFDWEDGVSPSGEHYDIVMKDIVAVNHLALTKAARGGKYACILDSREVIMKERHSGLFYNIYKHIKGVMDSGDTSFYGMLDSLVDSRLKLSQTDIVERVSKLKAIVDYLPDSDGKLQLNRYIDDLPRINEENDEAANEIKIIVVNIFHTLDSEAVKDAYKEDPKAVSEEKAADEAPKQEEEPNKDEAPSSEESATEEGKESPEHEASETPAEESQEHKNAEPAVGLDDTIFDKGPDELTPEEACYVHKKLMAMLKDYLVKEVLENSPAPVQEDQKTMPEAEPPKPEESAPAEAEKKEPVKDSEDHKDLSENREPSYPVDLLIGDATPSGEANSTFDIDSFFVTSFKGGK
jgi:hypothetical protein